MVIRVTFDSNNWEQVVRPESHPKAAERQAWLFDVLDAVKTRRIEGFLCESIVTLEAVKRSDRADFLMSQTMEPRVLDTGHSDFQPVVIAPNQSARPPLMPVLADRLRDAVALGFRLIKLPYFNEVDIPAAYFADEPADFVDRFGPIAHAITMKGVGQAPLQALAKELSWRSGGSHTYSVRALPAVGGLSPAEVKEVAKAVAEASDGDAVAAHLAMGNDFFVTEDHGGSAGAPSVLNPDHRKWLMEEYAIRFLTVRELAEMMGPSRSSKN